MPLAGLGLAPLVGLAAPGPEPQKRQATAKQQAIVPPSVRAVPGPELQKKQVIAVQQLLVRLVELELLHQQS